MAIFWLVNISSSIDLDALYGKLSQWFQLPVQQLSGNASCNIAWKQDTGNRITANGTLSTTPLRIMLATGRLNEPAWKGQFQLVGTLDHGSLIQLDRGTISLDSDGENLKAELMEPLSWMPPAPGAAPMPPASITLQLVGDIGMLMRRAQMVAGIDPGLSIEGLCDVKAQGAVDMNHLEVTAATFSAKQFAMKNASFQVREPLVQGTFAGRVDTNDFARLKVDNLLVQADHLH